MHNMYSCRTRRPEQDGREKACRTGGVFLELAAGIGFLGGEQWD